MRKRWIIVAGMLLGVLSIASSAELVVYDSDYWMDALTTEQLAEYIAKGKIDQQTYDRRPRRGDIVDVKPDGFFKDKLKCNKGFRIVRVTDLSLGDAAGLSVSSTVMDTRFRFRCDTATANYEAVTTSEVLIYDKNSDDYVSFAEPKEHHETMLLASVLVTSGLGVGLWRWRR